jgi:hypothetical protein
MFSSRQKLRQRVASKFDAYENYADAPADGPAAVAPGRTQLQATVGNPQFTAQFDMSLKLLYFTENGAGVYTLKTPAQLAAAQAQLATKLPAFLFGHSDYAGGFARLKAAFPVAGGWLYGIPFVYGTGDTRPGCIYSVFDASVTAQLVQGDLVQPFTATLGGVNYVALSVIRCNQVAYGTLLDSLGSDMFQMNMIRYILSDTSNVGLAQYANNISVFKQSLFGKFDSDFVSPNSFKLPEQQQDGVIDIPLVKGIDKQIALATLQNYDVPNVQWSIFVAMVNKLGYNS